jgi:hypothetical protein
MSEPVGQSKRMSAVEAITNTTVGFVIALVCQVWIVSYYGIKTTFQQDVLMTTFFTGVSIIRGYMVRRFFNWLHVAGASMFCVRRITDTDPGPRIHGVEVVLWGRYFEITSAGNLFKPVRRGPGRVILRDGTPQARRIPEHHRTLILTIGKEATT